EIFVDQAYRIEGLTLPDDACVFDVGANIGLFSLYVKGIQPRARIYAFEPIASTFALLKGNTEAYGAGIVVENLGLSDRDGTAVFRHYPKMSVNSGVYGDPEAE